MFVRSLIPLLFVCSIVVAQEAKIEPKTEVKPDKKPNSTPGETQFEAKFADGSTIQLIVVETTVSVTTKYGKLSVPIDDVKRIDLGFRYPEGVEKKIAEACENLGASEYRLRDEAKKVLLSYKELSVPMLKKAMKSSIVEASKSAEEVYNKIEAIVPKEKMEPREFDIVTTTTMTIRGNLEIAGLKAKTKYFGENTIKLTDLRELRPIGSASLDNFALDSAKYAKQQWTTWYDTGVEVTSDSPLEITATGKIDQWSQSPGSYMCPPQGTGAYIAAPPTQANPNGVQYKSGAIYGKIGEKGELFLIGDRFRTAKPPTTGKLYIIIAPSNWGNDSVGEYKVTIKTGE